MNPEAGGGTAGFTMESWDSFAEINIGAALLRAGDRCAFPDCRQPFARARATQRYCCAACRRADQTEARLVGHMLARPALAAREGKHAKDWREQELGRMGRAYVDQVTTRWRDARRQRAADAEARLSAAAASDAVAPLHKPDPAQPVSRMPHAEECAP